MVNLEQEVNFNHIFKMTGYESLLTTQDINRRKWHLLNTYQMPCTLHILCHLIPMRTKGGRSCLFLQMGTIKLRRLRNLPKVKKAASGTARNAICPASCFSH